MAPGIGDIVLNFESTNEAKIVKSVLSKYLIKANILTWKGSKPSNNIQAKARDKRYKFLFKQCEKYKIKYILLGHQQEDLFENFLIRMLRGSGLKGLVSLDIGELYLYDGDGGFDVTQDTRIDSALFDSDSLFFEATGLSSGINDINFYLNNVKNIR